MSDHTDAKPDYDKDGAGELNLRDVGHSLPDLDEADARPGGGSGDRRSRDLPTPVNFDDFWSDRYNMGHKERGLALIINNKNFHPSTGMKARKGTDVDASQMYNLLCTLGFEEVKQLNDLTVRDMLNTLRAASKEDYTNKDCFACVILSHGDEGYVYGTDNRVEVDELITPFKGNKCKSLAGKPKLFFIQACRGRQLDAGVDAHDGESDDPVDMRRIPTEADFLMAYSVVPGYFSWRNSEKGSWFIQAVVEVIDKYWRNLDLLTMLTRVNKKVALDFESSNKERDMSGKKQIPCITSMLTKDVFFHKV